MPAPLSGLRQLISELKRRKVFRVAAAYAAVGFVIVEAAEMMFPRVGLPEWSVTLIVWLVLLGFPAALVLAWAFELTPEGVRETVPAGEGERGEGDGRRAGATGAADAAVGRPSRVAFTALAGLLLLAAAGAGSWYLARDAGAGSTAPATRSLAVLPLDNLTGDPGQQYLADGMHEALIHELTRVEPLLVRSRTSVMRYRGERGSLPEIAAELGGVDYVVEGSVFQLPGTDSLRVTVQLIDASTDDHVWSRDYWGDLRHIRSLQGRVARGIAAEIQVALAPEDTTRIAAARPLDPSAVTLYMRARAAWRSGDADSVSRSIELYREALEIEPAYALAWAGLADSHLLLAHLRSPAHRAFPAAERAAERALELEDDLAQAHTALADVRFHYAWDWAGSERGFRRAIDLNPGYAVAHWWYGGLLAALGRMDEALRTIGKARELDPLDPQSHGFAVRIYYYARRFEGALETVRRLRELGVSEFMTVPWLALSHHALGDSERALEMLGALPAETRSPYATTALARILAETGEEERARRLVAGLERAYREGRLHLPHLIAIGYVSLGERERALSWLETAAEDRDGALPWLTVEPAFDRLRSEPRFEALVSRMGLDGGGRGSARPASATRSRPRR